MEKALLGKRDPNLGYMNPTALIHVQHDIKRNWDSFSTQEKFFLEKVIQRIDVIIHIQKGWIKGGGTIARYRAKEHKKQHIKPGKEEESESAPTQKDLYDEASNVYKQTLNFTGTTLITLVTEIVQELNTAKAKKQNKNYINILDKINKELNVHIRGTSKMLEKMSGISMKSLFPSHLGLLTFFNGRILPLSQSLDPTSLEKGAVEGHCSGFVFAWAKEIAREGRFSNLLRFDQEAADEIGRQTSFSLETTAHFYPDEETNYYNISHELISRLNTNNTYALNIVAIRPKLEAHIMGLRRIPNSSTIEIFDPNFGVIVFEHKEEAAAFLATHLSFYSDTMSVLTDINLNIYFSQPSTAVASIPKLSQESLPENWLASLENNNRFFLDTAFSISELKQKKILLPDLGKEIIDKEPLLARTRRLLKQLNFFKYAPFVAIENVTEKFEPIFLQRIQERNYDVNAESNSLKKSVIEKINQQIGRLQNATFDKKISQNKIDALNLLISDIQEASPLVTLQHIVNSWLDKIPPGQQATSREVINEHRVFNHTGKTTTTIFIENLLSEEISVYPVVISRELILNRLELYARENEDEKLMSLFKDSSLGDEDKLKNVVQMLRKEKGIGNILKDVNLNSPWGLLATYSKLEEVFPIKLTETPSLKR